MSAPPPNIMQTGLVNMHDYFGMNKFIAFEFFQQIIQHLQLFEIQSIHTMYIQLNKKNNFLKKCIQIKCSDKK